MTQRELILRFQELKKIEPRKDWVVLAKQQILGNDKVESRVIATRSTGFGIGDIFRVLLERKFAYSLATLLLVFLGAFGFLKYGLMNEGSTNTQEAIKFAPNSTAALITPEAVKIDIEAFKTKSQNLAQVSKDKSQNISKAIDEMKEATKNLTTTLEKDPQLARVIASDINSNKVYLDVVHGDDLKETSDALYKAIDSQMIEDLEKITLTQDQQKMFDTVKELYKEGEYSAALEKILLISSNDSK